MRNLEWKIILFIKKILLKSPLSSTIFPVVFTSKCVNLLINVYATIDYLKFYWYAFLKQPWKCQNYPETHWNALLSRRVSYIERRQYNKALYVLYKNPLQ